MSKTQAYISQSVPETKTQEAPSPWWLVCLGVLAVPFFFTGNNSPEQQALAERRSQLAKMPQAERDRLKQNAAVFETLTEGEQSQLRELDQTIQASEDHRDTLQKLNRWLETLSPWERQEFREAKSIEAKIAVVQSIETKRLEVQKAREEEDREWQNIAKRSLSFWDESRPRNEGISSSQVFDMLKVLKKKYASEITSRKLALDCEASRSMGVLAGALRANLKKNPDAQKQPLPEEDIMEMIALIEDSEERIRIQKFYDEKGARGIVSYLVMKLHSAWWREARESHQSREELEQIAKTLGGRVLEEFEKRKAEDPRRAYLTLLFVTRPANFRADTKELTTVLAELGFKLPSFRPGGGRPGEKNGGNGGRGRRPGEGRGFGGPGGKESDDRGPGREPEDRGPGGRDGEPDGRGPRGPFDGRAR